MRSIAVFHGTDFKYNRKISETKIQLYAMPYDENYHTNSTAETN